MPGPSDDCSNSLERWRARTCLTREPIFCRRGEHRCDGLIPGSIAHALDLFYHTSWKTPFGRFHRQLTRSTLACQRSGAVKASSACSGETVFPLPIPYLEAELEVGAGGDHPRRLEHQGALKSLGTARLVNMLCSLLSFFEAGCPRGQGSFELGSGELNSAQQLVVRRLEQEAILFSSSSGGDIASSGRGRARLAAAVTTAARSASVYNKATSKGDSSLVQVAEDVDLSRISFPDRAGLLAGAEVMSPERARVFRDLEQIILPEEQVPKIGIRSCHRVRIEDEQKFLEILLRSEMGVLVEEDLLPRHPHGGHLLKGGCFAVAHTRGRQRLIYDRRSVNETERDLSDEWLHLPHGTQWCDLLLEPGDVVRGATADLSNWFYQLRHSGLWHRRQALGRRVPGALFAASHGTIPGKNYRLCLRVVAMGDKNGVPIAQECHEEILRRGGVLQPEQTLRYGQSFPLSKVVQGAYVDDLMVAGIVPRERSHCKPGHAEGCVHCRSDAGHMPDIDTFERAIAAYDAVGAQKAAEKITDFSTCFTCWGTEVDGDRGRVAVSAEKRRQSFRLTLAVLLSGLVTKAL